MATQLVSIEEKDVELPLGIELGHPNSMPTPFRPCTTDEYWHRHSIPQAIIYRQIFLEGWKTVRNVYIEVYHDYCLAVAAPSNWKLDRNAEYDIHWTEDPLYFYIGCNHQFRELSQEECRERGLKHFGSCWHVDECTLCHTINARDSSG